MMKSSFPLQLPRWFRWPCFGSSPFLMINSPAAVAMISKRLVVQKLNFMPTGSGISRSSHYWMPGLLQELLYFVSCKNWLESIVGHVFEPFFISSSKECIHGENIATICTCWNTNTTVMINVTAFYESVLQGAQPIGHWSHIWWPCSEADMLGVYCSDFLWS